MNKVSLKFIKTTTILTGLALFFGSLVIILPSQLTSFQSYADMLGMITLIFGSVSLTANVVCSFSASKWKNKIKYIILALLCGIVAFLGYLVIWWFG